MKLKIVGGEVMRKSIIQGIVILTIALVFSATAKSSLAQCRTVDLANLKSYPVGEDISIIKDPTNEWAYRFNENPDAAKRLLSILQAYKVKTICHVPGSGDSAYGYDYESIYDVLLLTENGQPIKGNLLPKSEPEQCVSFKPSALHVIYSDSEQAQVLTDGSVILESSSLYTEQLKQAMSMIQQYSLDTKCNFYFGYYKSQHPLETKTISNTT